MVGADPTAAPMSNTRSHSFSLSLILPPTLTHSHSPGSPGLVAQTTPTNVPSYGETNAIFFPGIMRANLHYFSVTRFFVQRHDDLMDDPFFLHLGLSWGLPAETMFFADPLITLPTFFLLPL